MYSGFSKSGTVDESSLLVGNWEEILAVVSTTDYQIGNVPDGTLEISREYYTHEGTSFPKKVDLVVPTKAGMKFSGKVEEINKQNVSLLLGGTLIPSLNYVYVGQLATTYYFSLRGKRVRISDSVAIEFCMWKCLITSLFSLAGGDDAQGSPFEATALDDQDGDNGGSAGAPLGWIWVPNKGT